MVSKKQASINKKAAPQQQVSQSAMHNPEVLEEQNHPALNLQRARLASKTLSPHDVLQLQRTIGNQAVSRVLSVVSQHQHHSPGDTSSIGGDRSQKVLQRRNEISSNVIIQRMKGVQGVLRAGTRLYHGTRWKEGDEKWWEGNNPYPNKVGEDGGISFTLDKEATPKVKNANVVLIYEVRKDIVLYTCNSKPNSKICGSVIRFAPCPGILPGWTHR